MQFIVESKHLCIILTLGLNIPIKYRSNDKARVRCKLFQKPGNISNERKWEYSGVVKRWLMDYVWNVAINVFIMDKNIIWGDMTSIESNLYDTILEALKTNWWPFFMPICNIEWLFLLWSNINVIEQVCLLIQCSVGVKSNRIMDEKIEYI